MKKIFIGCDNAAVDLKKHIENVLKSQHISYEDVGVFDQNDDTPYPIIAKRVIDKIKNSEGNAEGILLCGTGIGMAMVANKFKGIYAATCHDIFSAERARLSNDTNILTMGARVVGPSLAKRILSEWLSLEFQPSSSSAKIAKMKEYEMQNFK